MKDETLEIINKINEFKRLLPRCRLSKDVETVGLTMQYYCELEELKQKIGINDKATRKDLERVNEIYNHIKRLYGK